MQENESLSQISGICKIIDKFSETSNESDLNDITIKDIFQKLSLLPQIIITNLSKGYSLFFNNLINFFLFYNILISILKIEKRFIQQYSFKNQTEEFSRLNIINEKIIEISKNLMDSTLRERISDFAIIVFTELKVLEMLKICLQSIDKNEIEGNIFYNLENLYLFYVIKI